MISFTMKEMVSIYMMIIKKSKQDLNIKDMELL